jgi:glyoxylase-like metal-dependent hydrolase (beta-lactamase superfamily II)
MDHWGGSRVCCTSKGADVTHVIQTHYHANHSSGVCEVLSETGATLVCFGIRDYWESRILLASSTVRPDGLSGKTTTLDVIRGIPTKNGSIKLINTKELVVEVHHTSRFTHVSDIVLVVVDNDAAGEMVLYEADFYNAGTGFNILEGGPQVVFQTLHDIGLIDARCESSYPLTIVPAHGVPTMLEDAIAELNRLAFDVRAKYNYWF